jgi:uncharacterized protein with von Willebrand factor type A (vWA) domain
MEHRIARFIAGLRASGVRVSIAESEDAWNAITHMGIADREAFKLTLRSTLVKDAVNIPIFEELFPLYFGLGAPPLMNPQAELSEEEQKMLQEAVDWLAGDLEELLNWLFSGQGPTEEELGDLADQAGMDFANAPYQSRWYARRMQRLLGWDRLRDVLEMVYELLAQMGMDPQTIAHLRQQVAENQEALEQQLEHAAGQRIQDNLIDRRENQLQETIHDLMKRSFGSLNETEMDALRDQVRRLAARLRSRAALRQKRAKRGKLDAKATIRANQRYGGVPLEIKLRRRRQKPKLVLFMDVSQSMRPVIEFFLRLLYELQDQVDKTTSFAFYERLEDITDEMRAFSVDAALEHVFTLFPYIPYGTNLGLSLREFSARHLGTIDHRTTVIVVGDGRNNFNDPELEIVEGIRRRARRLIWLNPEYPRQWGTGDSDMLKYAPLCDAVYRVRNLAQLTEAIDKMLA